MVNVGVTQLEHSMLTIFVHIRWVATYLLRQDEQMLIPVIQGLGLTKESLFSVCPVLNTKFSTTKEKIGIKQITIQDTRIAQKLSEQAQESLAAAINIKKSIFLSRIKDSTSNFKFQTLTSSFKFKT